MSPAARRGEVPPGLHRPVGQQPAPRRRGCRRCPGNISAGGSPARSPSAGETSGRPRSSGSRPTSRRTRRASSGAATGRRRRTPRWRACSWSGRPTASAAAAARLWSAPVAQRRVRGRARSRHPRSRPPAPAPRVGGPPGDQVGDRLVGVAPGVLGRERVVRQHDPGLERGRERARYRRWKGVDPGHEAAAVEVDHGPSRVRTARRDDVRRELPGRPLQHLGDDREAALEPRHQPGRQPAARRRVHDHEPGALDPRRSRARRCGGAAKGHRPGEGAGDGGSGRGPRSSWLQCHQIGGGRCLVVGRTRPPRSHRGTTCPFRIIQKAPVTGLYGGFLTAYARRTYQPGA